MTRTALIFILLINLTKTSSLAQMVPEKFPDILYTENFETDKGLWKVMSNADNLFLIQEGKYLLQRKNPKTAYSIFPKWENPANSFEITINIILESLEGAESAAGLIFMAQSDGTGAFVFEINSKKQYRLKQLVGLNYRLLTGSPKAGGWVDSPMLNGINQTNLLQVKTSNRNYDIYINQNYIFSFKELAYKTGNIGISAGPLSKFSVDQISVYTSGDFKNGVEIKKTDSLISGSESEEQAGNELQKLKHENKLLKDSLTYYRREYLKMKSINNKTGVQSVEPVKHPE